MNIFETKSKYFENNNSNFAKMFSTSSISLVLVLVGIVVLAMSIHGCLQNSAEAKLVKNTKHWLTAYGFTYSGLHFKWVTDEDEGTYKNEIRYLFTVDEISHEDLNDGKKICATDSDPVDLIVTASYEKLEVRNIGLKWKDGYIRKHFDDWFHYLNHPSSLEEN